MDDVARESGRENAARDFEQPRLAVCEIHGQEYDPLTSTRCSLCRLEEERRTPRRRSRRPSPLLILLALALLSGAVFWFALGRGIVGLQQILQQYSALQLLGTAPKADGSAADQPASEAVVPQAEKPSELPMSALQVDPDPYRNLIRRIEDVLYQGPTGGFIDIRRLVDGSQRLSGEMGRRESRYVSTQMTSRLLAWASSIDRGTGEGITSDELSRIRRDWERLRAASFLPADWFRDDVAESLAAESVSPRLRQPDPAKLETLTGVARDIRRLIAQGRVSSRMVGELTSPNQQGRAAADIRNRWRIWAPQWAAKVQQLKQRMPEIQGPSADRRLVMAYRRLDSALHYLALVVAANAVEGVPSISRRDGYLNTALGEVEQAEAHLEELSEFL